MSAKELYIETCKEIEEFRINNNETEKNFKQLSILFQKLTQSNSFIYIYNEHIYH